VGHFQSIRVDVVGTIYNEGGERLRRSPAKQFLDDVLDRHGLSQPDGRPIYKYRMEFDEFKRGRAILTQYAGFLDPDQRHLCAIFALVTSEWYRREAASLFRRWSDVGVVPQNLSVKERNEIAEAGLRWWGQAPKITRNGIGKRREFLLTLAINGGLPSALIIGETGNRVRRFFLGVMEDALATNAALDISEITPYAEKHAEGLPEGYRDETIYELTAELICELLACRGKLPSDQWQANPAGWLDIHEPDWRKRLPIHLPDDTSACNRLFNDLLTVEPRARGNGIGLKRQLVRSPSGNWQQGFVVLADGQLAFDALANYSEGRFRAYFSGTAGHLTSREFAHLYRSETEKSGSFNVTAHSVGQLGFIGPVPFTETVSVTLFRDGQSLPTTSWPGGSAKISSCYVLKPTSDAGRLELLGTGSVKSPIPVLFVLTASTNSVLGHEGGSAELIWQGLDTSLWRVEGMALVETVEGDRYRVHSGSDEADERRLDFNYCLLPQISMADSSVQTVEAPLHPRLLGLTGAGATQRQNLRFVQGGRQITERDVSSGIVIVYWYDEEGFLIDRAKLMVLPRHFEISGQIEKEGARISWKGLQGWAVTANAASPALETTESSFLCPWGGIPVNQQLLHLTDPQQVKTVVKLRLASHRTMLVDAHGRIRTDQPELSSADLRGALLLTDRPTLVDLELKGAGEVRALIAREIEGETPMVRLGDLADRLLGLSVNRGPSIDIRDDRQRLVCKIRRPQQQPEINGLLVRFTSHEDDGEIVVARSLLKPEEEFQLMPSLNGWYALPTGAVGRYLVYRRKGDAVTTRPTPVDVAITPGSSMPSNRFVQVSLLEDETERRRSYRTLMTSIVGDPLAGQETSWIVKLVHSLRGLSPRALDLTRELPNHPALLCRLLFAATTERLEAILDLERDLPFLWMAQPLPAWQTAAVAEWERYKAELMPILGESEANSKSFELMKIRLETLVERTSWFAGIRQALSFPGDVAGSLHQLTQAHVRLHSDKPSSIATHLIRAAERLPVPPMIANLNYQQHTTLLAPVVLAGLAHERLALTSGIAADLRNAMDIDGSYIAAAFPHCLKLAKS